MQMRAYKGSVSEWFKTSRDNLNMTQAENIKFTLKRISSENNSENLILSRIHPHQNLHLVYML